MLTGLGLRNFKAFGDEMQEAPLSKITLIYGPNSGGKSSIIQALLLLKQSLRNNYAYRERLLVPRGEYTDLGSFQSLMHGHDLDRELGISVKYRNLVIDSEHRLDESESYHVDENDVILTYSSAGKLRKVRHKITSHENKELLLDATAVKHTSLSGWQGSVKVFDPDGNNPIASDDIVFLSSDMLAEGESFPLPTLALPGMNMARELVQDLTQSISEAWPSSERLLSTTRLRRAGELAQALDRAQHRALDWAQHRVRALERIHQARAQRYRKVLAQARAREALQRAEEQAGVRAEELARSLELNNRIGELNLSHKHILDLTPENMPEDYERHLRSVNYLGPLRSAPERLYRLSSENDDSADITGIQGELSAGALYHREEVRDVVNDWFERFEIPYELSVIKLGEESLAGEHITIALTDKRTDTQVTLADVGYGINQILPVIIEGVASQEGSILCVEQPEIHLHPRLQANIADLMIDTIADEPDSDTYLLMAASFDEDPFMGKQWIVETHSELLITRLQRRIREGKIKSEDISVLYVDPDDEHCEGSAIIKLRLDENGDFIDHWPHGFFDEAFNELMAEPEDASTPVTNPAKNSGMATSTQSDESLDG